MLQLTFSATQVVSALVSVFVFQFVAARAFWRKHEEFIDQKFKLLHNDVEHLEGMLERAEKKTSKFEKRIANIEQALASNRIRIRSIEDDDHPDD